MDRISRSLTIVLACIFASAWLTVAPVQTVRAAGQTFIVTTTADPISDPPDSGCAVPTNCTLRQALNSANLAANAGSTITFNIPLSDPGFEWGRSWIITPTIALPQITQNGTTVDGKTQTDGVGNTNNDGAEVIIDGSNVTTTGGLQIVSNGNTVRGIGFANFRGAGAPGQLKGVGIEISGNNNIIVGNYIGLTVGVSGTIRGANADAGIIIYGNSNRVGGNNTGATTEFNVISGNTGDGILINGGDSNIIAGNYIGTNGDISAAIPNDGNGVNIRLGGNDNVIGNFEAIAGVSYRNFIGGNGAYGIQITDSSRNKIYGNFLGLTRSGQAKISNGLGGVRIDGNTSNSALDNIVGAASPASSMRNLIAGDAGPGIAVTGFGAKRTIIVNNYIGFASNNLPPTGAANQLQSGITVSEGASDTQIGGSIAGGERNVIGNIRGDAVSVSGRQQVNPFPLTLISRNTKIQGNLIGQRPTSQAASNSGAGIVLQTLVQQSQIGGTSDQTNIVANNGSDGIRLAGTGITTTTIGINTITTNGQNGINIGAATTTLLAGTSSTNLVVTNNLISGISVTGATNLNLTFASITGNGADGLIVSGGSATNVLSSTLTGNADNGVRATGTTTLLVRGSAVNRNSDEGLIVSGGSQVQIRANTVISNTFNGVRVTGGAQRVSIIDNSISENRLKGIELDPENLFPSGDSSLANHDIDPPFNIKLRQDGRITGRVRADTSDAGRTAASCLPATTCRIQIFTTIGDGQGKTQLTSPVGTVPLQIDASGYFTATLPSLPPQIALTATDAAGNTSEFTSFTRQIGPLAMTALRPVPPQQNAVPGQVVTYTARLTNTGTIGLTDLRYSFTSSQRLTNAEVSFAPPAPLTLDGGEGKTVTMTIALPRGADPRVRAGTVETTRMIVTSTRYTTVTVGLDTRTTIDPIALVAVSPRIASAEGVAGKITSYTHVITNSGNVTATIDLNQVVDPISGSVGYTTTLPLQVVVPPGQTRTIGIPVYVDKGATAGTVNRTVVNLTVAGYPSQNTTLVDTTTVIVTPAALFNPSELVGTSKAGGEVPFRVTVTSRSNGRATFRFATSSNLGSKFRFQPDQTGVTLNPDNSFTLDTTGGGSSATFLVYVRIDRFVQKGQRDIGTIGLETLDKKPVAGASARYVIDVTANADFLLYLPMVWR